LLALGSCRSDFETVANTGDLTFSRDTIYLDTVLQILVLVPTDKSVQSQQNDINIPTIKLGKQLNSNTV
jgi:hypothetical protein